MNRGPSGSKSGVLPDLSFESKLLLARIVRLGFRYLGWSERGRCLQIVLFFKIIAELAKSPARGLSTQPLAPEFAKRQVHLWRLKSATPGIPVLSAFGTRPILGTNPANQEESCSRGSGIGNLRPLLSNLIFWENRGAQVGSTGKLGTICAVLHLQNRARAPANDDA